MDPRKCKFTTFAGIKSRKWRTNFSCGDIGPANQMVIIVKEEKTLCLTHTHQNRCQKWSFRTQKLSFCFQIFFLEERDIQIGYDIYVMNQEMIGLKEVSSMFYAATGLAQ